MEDLLSVSITDYTFLQNSLGRYTVYCINYNDFGEFRTCYRRYSEFNLFDKKLCIMRNDDIGTGLSINNSLNDRSILSKFSLGSMTSVFSKRATLVPLPPKKFFYRFENEFLETRMTQLDSYFKSAVNEILSGKLPGHLDTLCDFLKVSDSCIPYLKLINSRNDNVQGVDNAISQLKNYWERMGKVDYRAAHLSVMNKFIDILENFDGEIASKVLLCLLYIMHNSDESLEKKYSNKFFEICSKIKMQVPITNVLDLSEITGLLASQCTICMLNKEYSKNLPPCDLGNNYSLIPTWRDRNYQCFFKSDDDLFNFYYQLSAIESPEATIAVGLSSAYLLVNNWFEGNHVKEAENFVFAASKALDAGMIEIQFVSFICNLFSGISFNNLKLILNSPYRSLPLSIILKRIEIDFSELYTINDVDECISNFSFENSGRSKEFENVIISGEINEVLKDMDIVIDGIKKFRWNSSFRELLGKIVYSIYPQSSWTNQVTPRSSMEAKAFTDAAKILLLLPWPTINSNDSSFDENNNLSHNDNIDDSRIKSFNDPFWLKLNTLYSTNYSKSKEIKSVDLFDENATVPTNSTCYMPDCWYSVSMTTNERVKEEMDFSKSFPSLQITSLLMHSRLGIYSTVYESILSEIDKFYQYFDELDLSLATHLKGNDPITAYLSDIDLENRFIETLYCILNREKSASPNKSLFKQCAAFLLVLTEYKMVRDKLKIAADKIIAVFNLGRDMLSKFGEISDVCKKFLDSLMEIVPEISSEEILRLSEEKVQTEKSAILHRSLLTKALRGLLDKTNELTRIRNMLDVTKSQIDHGKSFIGRTPKNSNQSMRKSFKDTIEELEMEYSRLEKEDKILEDQIMKEEAEVEELRLKSSSFNAKLKKLETELNDLRRNQSDVRLVSFLRSIALETRLRECLAMSSQIEAIKNRIDRYLGNLEDDVKDQIKHRESLKDALKGLFELSQDLYKMLE